MTDLPGWTHRTPGTLLCFRPRASRDNRQVVHGKNGPQCDGTCSIQSFMSFHWLIDSCLKELHHQNNPTRCCTHSHPLFLDYVSFFAQRPKKFALIFIFLNLYGPDQLIRKTIAIPSPKIERLKTINKIILLAWDVPGPWLETLLLLKWF